MLCCVGLIGGSVVGQALGGPWTFIAPAAGFGVGLVADMKMMKGLHRKADTEPKAPDRGAAAAPAAQSSACCGVASGLTRMFGTGEKKKGEMTLAEIRRTYETGPSNPPQQAQPLAAGTAATVEPVAVEKAKSA